VNFPEIEEKVAALSKSERLQLMEILWNAICKDEPLSSAWHGDVLAARLVKAEAGNTQFLTMAELEAHFAR